MSCDERPQGTACNCCGDTELRELISQLTARIDNYRTEFLEYISRPQVVPQFVDCNGVPIPLNGSIATCADLSRVTGGVSGGGSQNGGLVDCNGSPLTSAPSCAEFGALRSQVMDNTRAITNITNILDTLPRQPNPGGGGIGNAIDKAILDGLQEQITSIAVQLNDFRNSTNQRLLDLEGCCQEYRNGKGQGGASDGACDYNGWNVVAVRHRRSGGDDDTSQYTVTITGPAYKTAAVEVTGGFSHIQELQRTVTLGGNGQYAYSVSAGSSILAPSAVSVVHCGRVVATTTIVNM